VGIFNTNMVYEASCANAPVKHIPPDFAKEVCKSHHRKPLLSDSKRLSVVAVGKGLAEGGEGGSEAMRRAAGS
jgi:hypothetical protein